MIKQLRYLCTLLLMAVAGVAWGDSWVITDAPSLKSGDVVVITGTNANGTYGMSNNNGTSSAPGATAVTIDGDKLSSSASVDNLQWTVTVGEINGERTYEFAAGSNKLYCTNTNNGVRVGTNDNKTFVFKDNYLYNSATSRYIGIYNNADWRCYTSINNNIKDQTFAFYKKTSDGKAEANLSFSPSSVTIHVGETMPQITFSNPNNLDVVFASSNNNVAVVSTDGTISLVNDGMGQAVITASSEETENYSLGNATCTINVLPIGGTLEDPLTVEEAIIFISTLENKVNSEYVYVRGIVSALGEFSSEYGNYVYYISDDGTETNQLEVYRGKYLEDANFTSANQLTVGDKVIVYGPLVNFNGTYEFTTGNYIYAFENNLAKCDLSFDKTAVSVELNSEFTAPTLNNPHELSVSYSSSNTDVATVDATTGDVTISAIGETTITASFAGNDSYEEGSASYVLTVTDPNAAGSQANPYTVAEARAAIDAGSGVTGVYVKGKVSKIVTAYSEQFGNISYNISDGGTETAAQLQAFRGKSYEGANFTSADDIKVGDEVVVYGNLTKYKDTYEFEADNQLVSLVRPATPAVLPVPTFSPAAGEVEAGTLVTISVAEDENVDYVEYSFDQATWNEYTVGETEIKITEETTIYARSVGTDGSYSEVASAKYTIKVETVAVLPFVWEGGASANFLALDGVTAEGLGTSDYGETHNPYNIKLDNTGDYIQVNTDSQPGKVIVGVKMVGGATASTITVQESADGVNFTNVQALSISGKQNDILTLETTNAFGTDSRYVRLTFTKGSNVGVGPITITKPATEIVAEETLEIEASATSGEIAYSIVYPQVGVDLTAAADVDWISGVTVASDKVKFATTVNTGAERSGNITLTYGTLTKVVKVTQAAAPQMYTLTIGNPENVTITATYNVDQVIINGESAELENGTEVSFALTIPEGYALESLTVAGAEEGQTVTPTENATTPGVYTFTMPAFNVTINATVAKIETTTYTLATSVTPGKRYIIVGVNENKYKAMGEQKSNNRAAVEISVNDKTATVPSTAGVYEFVIDGNATDGFTIYDESEESTGYLYAASSEKNWLKTQKENDVNGLWNIAFDGDVPTIIATGVASPKAQGQDITNTEIAKFNADSILFVVISHIANVITAIAITIGTKTPATLSAIFSIGALETEASSTNFTILANVVSSPTFNACILNVPFLF